MVEVDYHLHCVLNCFAIVPDIDQLRKLCKGLQKDVKQLQQCADYHGTTTGSEGHSYM